MAFWDGSRWIRTTPRPATTGRRRFRDWVATLVMLLAVVALAAPLRQSNAATAVLTINPASALSGSNVTVVGTSLPAKTAVRLTFDGALTAVSARTSPSGGFKASLTVPNAAVGSHTVAAVSVTSNAHKGTKQSIVLGVIFAAGTLTIAAPTQATVAPTAAPTAVTTASPTRSPSATPATTATPDAASTAVPSATAPSTPAATDNPVASSPPVDEGLGFVQRRGTTLSLNGQRWRFTGMTIYNANSRTQSTCWDTLNEGTRLSDSLAQLRGQEVFRAWFYQGLALTNGKRDWSAFDKTLSVAAAHGMKVIVSLSGQGGDCKDYPVDTPKFEDWYRTGYTRAEASGTSYREWIHEVAARYKDNPAIAAYQLMGEAEDPVDASGRCSSTANETLKAWADDSASVIKAVDSNHLVSVGVIGSGQCGAAGTAYVQLHSGPDIDLCTREDYDNPNDPIPGDEWNGMATRIAECTSLNKPLIVTESGIQRTVPDRALKWEAKFSAQFAAGVAGILIWDWSPRWIADNYEVMPDDPVLPLLERY